MWVVMRFCSIWQTPEHNVVCSGESAQSGSGRRKQEAVRGSAGGSYRLEAGSGVSGRREHNREPGFCHSGSRRPTCHCRGHVIWGECVCVVMIYGNSLAWPKLRGGQEWVPWAVFRCSPLELQLVTEAAVMVLHLHPRGGRQWPQYCWWAASMRIKLVNKKRYRSVNT